MKLASCVMSSESIGSIKLRMLPFQIDSLDNSDRQIRFEIIQSIKFKAFWLYKNCREQQVTIFRHRRWFCLLRLNCDNDGLKLSGITIGIPAAFSVDTLCNSSLKAWEGQEYSVAGRLWSYHSND